MRERRQKTPDFQMPRKREWFNFTLGHFKYISRLEFPSLLLFYITFYRHYILWIFQFSINLQIQMKVKLSFFIPVKCYVMQPMLQLFSEVFMQKKSLTVKQNSHPQNLASLYSCYSPYTVLLATTQLHLTPIPDYMCIMNYYKNLYKLKFHKTNKCYPLKL